MKEEKFFDQVEAEAAELQRNSDGESRGATNIEWETVSEEELDSGAIAALARIDHRDKVTVRLCVELGRICCCKKAKLKDGAGQERFTDWCARVLKKSRQSVSVYMRIFRGRDDLLEATEWARARQHRLADSTSVGDLAALLSVFGRAKTARSDDSNSSLQPIEPRVELKPDRLTRAALQAQVELLRAEVDGERESLSKLVALALAAKAGDETTLQELRSAALGVQQRLRTVVLVEMPSALDIAGDQQRSSAHQTSDPAVAWEDLDLRDAVELSSSSVTELSKTLNAKSSGLTSEQSPTTHSEAKNAFEHGRSRGAEKNSSKSRGRS